jgi:hypothetical protein
MKSSDCGVDKKQIAVTVVKSVIWRLVQAHPLYRVIMLSFWLLALTAALGLAAFTSLFVF